MFRVSWTAEISPCWAPKPTLCIWVGTLPACQSPISLSPLISCRLSAVVCLVKAFSSLILSSNNLEYLEYLKEISWESIQ